MKFVEEPSVQIDDVKGFLDTHFSIDKIAAEKLDGFNLSENVSTFEKDCLEHIEAMKTAPK